MHQVSVDGIMCSVERGASSVSERVGRRAMLRTPVCDLLDMKVPIMQAAIWPATAPELVAAVSEAGGLGSIGSVFESAKSVERQIERVRELRNGPSRLTRWCRYSTNMPSKPPSKPNRQWCLWPS